VISDLRFYLFSFRIKKIRNQKSKISNHKSFVHRLLISIWALGNGLWGLVFVSR